MIKKNEKGNWILIDNENKVGEECAICGMIPVERHHIFGRRGFRDKSEKYHLTICLCHRHHSNFSKDGVHGQNKKLDMKIKKIAQKLFEIKYSHDLFIKEFKYNYL